MLQIKEVVNLITSAIKYDSYKESVEIANKLKVHADGDGPGELISERRPGEDKDIKAYREKIYEPITTSALSKVFVELGKIRRSSDWSIKFPESTSAKIRKGEHLSDYLEKKYPIYDSLTNWAFEELLKMYLVDPNSICIVKPINFEKEVTDFYKPVAEVIPSSDVIDFLDTEYAIVKSSENGSYTLNGKTMYDAEIFYYFDNSKIVRLQRNKPLDQNLSYVEYPNLAKALPAFKLPGIFHKKIGKNKVNKSRIYGMVPFLNEATREYSDLQAEVVQHIHSTMWYYSNTSCSTCSGTGRVLQTMPGANSKTQAACSECKGTGYLETSPYKQNFRVTPPSNLNAASIPTPPAGYIQKETAIVELQSKRVKEHINDALGVINMDYLTQVPLSQSGTAKAYDRDGANNFVHSIAEDIVRVMDRVIVLINNWRYSELITADELRDSQLPSITVPEKFDLFNSQILLQQIQAAKNAGVNSIVINEMVREYTVKYFNADPNVAKMLNAVLELDPLVGYTIDEKISMAGSGLIQKEDVVISLYVQMFIQQSIVSDIYFLEKSSQEKHKALKDLAQLKLKEMSEAEKLRLNIQPKELA